jgi:hypothetical protein
VLRGRYNAGYLTREQLQAELRSLMILGEDGRWWMLGLESNNWYSYDGKTWTPGVPPNYQPPVRGSGMRTETGMQEVVSPLGAELEIGEEGTIAPIEIDEDGMPLPRRVPQEDPGATLVSPNAPFMEPMRPSEAPTQSKSRQVEAESAAFVTAPARGEQPLRPAPAGQPVSGEPTIRSTPATPGADLTSRAESGAAPARRAIWSAQPPQAAENQFRIGEFTTRLRYTGARPPNPDTAHHACGIQRDRRHGPTLLVLLAMIGYYLYEVDRYSEAVDPPRARRPLRIRS